MSALAERQRRFIDALYGEPQREDLSGLRPDGVDAATRFGVYRRNLRRSLAGALRAAYPVVARLVGAAFFEAAAGHFIRDHPSTSGDLHRFGRDFPAFLERYRPAAPLPYLADVARLEWACHEALHAAEAQAFGFAALAALPAEARGEVCFELAPALRRVRSAHPVLAIHEANQPGADGSVERLEGPDRVLVRRTDGALVLERLTESEWRWLEALAEGLPLAALVDPGGLAMPVEVLRRWVAKAIVSGFSPPAS